MKKHLIVFLSLTVAAAAADLPRVFTPAGPDSPQLGPASEPNPAADFWRTKFQADEHAIAELRSQRATVAEQLLDAQLQIQDLAEALEEARKTIAQDEAKAAAAVPKK